MTGRWILTLLMVLLCAGQSLAAGEPGLQVQALKAGASVSLDRAVEDGKVIISVTDAEKRPLLGLSLNDFAISQAGRAAKILSVESFEENLDVPRHIILVLDNSFSMSERNAVKPLLAAMDELFKIVRPIDKVHMVVFDDRQTVKMAGRDLHVKVLESSDVNALKAFIAKAYSVDGMTSKTVLFEAMLAGVSLVSDMPDEEPKFMVVFSDGEDLNSGISAEEVTTSVSVLKRFETFSVDYMPGDGVDPFLAAFAERGNGQIWKAKQETNLLPIFQAVASRLQYHYVVTYAFPPTGSLVAAPASLTIEEVKTIDASPLLGHIYFDEGSADLHERYVRLADPAAAAAFDPAALRGTLEKYYQVLNVLGKRLADNPDATITLVGCNANSGAEKGKKQLSQQRAEAVQAYLRDTWGIAPERMLIESRNLPEMPSTSRQEEGRADNRRAEIRSEHPAILDLVRSTYISTTIDTRALTLVPTVDSAYGFVNWRVAAQGGSLALAELAGQGSPPQQITLPLRLTDLNALAAAGSVAVGMDLTDRKGQTLTLASNPVKVHFIETKQRVAEQQDFKVQEKYALILFDFDSDAIGPRNQTIVAEIVARIRELPTASVAIVGHTDNIGKDDYNQKLSERRAQAVYDQIMGLYGEDPTGRITHAGVGAGEPLYDNLSSEARAFNRTVTITLEYMTKE